MTFDQIVSRALNADDSASTALAYGGAEATARGAAHAARVDALARLAQAVVAQEISNTTKAIQKTNAEVAARMEDGY